MISQLDQGGRVAGVGRRRDQDPLVGGRASADSSIPSNVHGANAFDADQREFRLPRVHGPLLRGEGELGVVLIVDAVEFELDVGPHRSHLERRVDDDEHLRGVTRGAT